MKEKRYYIVNIYKADKNYINDEQFMEMAEEQGSVYSEKGFQDAFNSFEINTKTDVLRIIEVDTSETELDAINNGLSVIDKFIDKMTK